jgi:N-carbamoyl-L-amino-acid hydrolase
MAESGADLAALRAGKAHLDAARIAAFIEPHIEQGPVLEQAGIPVGIVTGVRGCLRHADARCHGTYAHSGAAPREARHDAVAASVELIQRLNEMWLEREQAGADLVFTVGQLNTDPAEAAPSKVAGETRFVLDFRGLEESVMREASRKAIALAAEIGRRHRVRFELGEPSYSYPAPMDPLLRRRLAGIARGLAIPTRELPSGAGHDAALFATFGVPTAMIFIRNAHGSHNPDEAMDIADFGQATALLMAFLADEKDDQ